MLTASFLLAASTFLTGAPPGDRGWVSRVSSTAELAPAGMPGTRVRMLIESPQGYLGHIQVRGLSKIEEHVHEKSAEYIYLLMGDAEVTIGTQKQTVMAGDAIYIPPGVKHSVSVGSAAVQAIQFFSPPGPEQRFKQQELDPKKAAEERVRREAAEKALQPPPK